MRWLNKSTIKSRILILTIIPMVVVVTLLLLRLNAVNNEVRNLQKLASQVQLSYVAGDLLTYAQKERTLAQVVVGATFSYENADKYLSNYRKVGDESNIRFAQLVQFSKSHHNDLNESISNELNKLIAHYQTITQARNNLLNLASLEQNDPLYRKLMTWPDKIVDLIKNVELTAAGSSSLSLLSQAYVSVVEISLSNTLFQGAALRSLDMSELDYKRFGTIQMSGFLARKYKKYFNKYAGEDLLHYFEKNYVESKSHKNFNDFTSKMRNFAGKKVSFSSEEIFKLTNAEQDNLKQIERHIAGLIEAETQKLLTDANNALMQMIILLIVLLLVITFTSIVIISSITKPLKSFVKIFNDIAQSKDISQQLPIDGKNELSDVLRAFNSLLSNFRDTLTGVIDGAYRVNNLSNEVAGLISENLENVSSQKISTDNVSVAIEEMSTTIEEVSRTTNMTSDSAQRAHQTSIHSADRANKSKNIMSQLIIELDSSVQQVTHLTSESESIGDVLNVIQGIAEQINLLALNAAIEAARAGEQGRGFAVVADEVGNLAQRTQQSTKEIRGKIESLQSGALTTTKGMNELQTKGEEAVGVVLESVKDFELLKGEIEGISDMSIQIAASSEEQTVVANDINQQSHTIRDDADKMAIQSDKIGNVCESLVKTSDALDELVSVFTI
ncbi:methyl-accepting chemotaxis protein [Colwellia sp. 6_MG-2023]|uniref:methyl-accepting chemotaxis protein n=1 Tax=Colwellia sp. 6_MG-2023 TaxID=3062676 RepID=UPI0026E44FDE|nr:methyl-accepting chemotaxis protein [Colwellia sp. 6_MG-2023]MDO6489637.1 methyl-accepting chemotaxis protein [Colwellia sp. 6_MG-2023]